MECFKMGCKKAPNSPLPTDTTDLHPHMEQLPLKKPRQLDEQSLCDKGYEGGIKASQRGRAVVSTTTTAPRHGDPQIEGISKVQNFPPRD